MITRAPFHRIKYVRDEEGKIVRRDLFVEICASAEDQSSHSYTNKYGGKVAIRKCHCGVYVDSGFPRCCRCYWLPSTEYQNDEIGYGADRSTMESLHERFRIGMVSVDFMINNHLASTIIVRDGRDQDHEDWWGG